MPQAAGVAGFFLVDFFADGFFFGDDVDDFFLAGAFFAFGFLAAGFFLAGAFFAFGFLAAGFFFLLAARMRFTSSAEAKPRFFPAALIFW